MYLFLFLKNTSGPLLHSLAHVDIPVYLKLPHIMCVSCEKIQLVRKNARAEFAASPALFVNHSAPSLFMHNFNELPIERMLC